MEKRAFAGRPGPCYTVPNLTAQGGSVLEQAQLHKETLIALRREVHRYPELGFGEVRTARLATERLVELGVHVKTGVVGEIGEGGRCIALRADMDALPGGCLVVSSH
jgi:metal-dependent amidase/aminoacylase/carboxypeptidase family protein